MKKVLVLGATGMVGHIVTLYLSQTKKYDIYNLCYKDTLNTKSIKCDVADLDKLKIILEEIKPDILINCIGILNDKSDEDKSYTVYINTFLPKWLEHYYRNSTCKIIHLSTDCVFTGNKGQYNEFDVKDSNTIYGLSKNFGEINNNKDLTIRTSIIGPELKNGVGLFNWFMHKKGKINGYEKVFWSGVTTLELAHFIDYAIENDITGLYNFTSKNKISKYDLLMLIKKIFNKPDIEIKPDVTKICDKSLITCRKDINFIVKDYEVMLFELKKWMENNVGIYQMYFSEEIKDRVIIIWSKFKTDKFNNDEEIIEWIKHRIKVFMNYTCLGFKNQTNQNFTYLINYDEKASKYIFEELKKYPSLPKNIVFTDNYHREIKRIASKYKYLYLVRIDSDDMYHKEFIQKLINFNPKSDTQALIAQKGYIYNSVNGDLGTWFYKSPPFFTLIYKTEEFLKGYRYEVHGHASVINLKNEIIEGENFVVIIHGKNTVSKFYSSFMKSKIKNLEEKQKIINEFDLKKLE